jgi:hypothetical protein
VFCESAEQLYFYDDIRHYFLYLDLRERLSLAFPAGLMSGAVFFRRINFNE